MCSWAELFSMALLTWIQSSTSYNHFRTETYWNATGECWLPKNGHFFLKFKTDVEKLIAQWNLGSRCQQFGLLPFNSENTMEGEMLQGTVDELAGGMIWIIVVMMATSYWGHLLHILIYSPLPIHAHLVIFSLVYRWRSWNSEKLSDLPKRVLIQV